MTSTALPLGLALTSLFVAAGPGLAQDLCETAAYLDEVHRLGSLDGEIAFSRISHLEVDSAHNIYVSQAGQYSISVFSADGRAVREIGRRGQGPGEFEWVPRLFGWTNGLFWAGDRYAIRHFDSNLAETARVTFSSPVPSEASIFVAGHALPDGSYLGVRQLTPPVERFFESDSLPLLRFDRHGSILDTILVVAQPPVVLGDRSQGSARILRRDPLSDWADLSWLPVTLSADGASVLTVATSAEPYFTVLRVGIRGDTLLSRRVAYEPRGIGRRELREIKDVFAASQSGRLGGQRETAQTRRIEEDARGSYRPPDHYPPVRRVVAGRDGSIWLLTQSWPLDDIWTVLDEDGGFLFRVAIPKGRGSSRPWEPDLFIYEASRDSVWGVTIDEFDVPYVHIYQIRGGCSGSPP